MSDTDSENSQAPSKKVLIIGLDNSGKTSILLSLTKTTNLLSYFSIKPTKGIQISSIEDGERIVKVWDFGAKKVIGTITSKTWTNTSKGLMN